MKSGARWQVWATTHDNGWRAWVAQRGAGIIVAGILGPRRCEETRCCESLAQGKAAALAILHKHTGHRCALGCSRWTQTLTERGGVAPLSLPVVMVGLAAALISAARL